MNSIIIFFMVAAVSSAEVVSESRRIPEKEVPGSYGWRSSVDKIEDRVISVINNLNKTLDRISVANVTLEAVYLAQVERENSTVDAAIGVIEQQICDARDLKKNVDRCEALGLKLTEEARIQADCDLQSCYNARSAVLVNETIDIEEEIAVGVQLLAKLDEIVLQCTLSGKRRPDGYCISKQLSPVIESVNAYETTSALLRRSVAKTLLVTEKDLIKCFESAQSTLSDALTNAEIETEVCIESC